MKSALEHPLYDVRAATMKALLAQSSGMLQWNVYKRLTSAVSGLS